MGHHHHHGGGGMGHHHHHHRGFGRGGRGQISTSWPFLAGLAALLFLYGAGSGFMTYRTYAHGEQGLAVVTRVEDSTTLMQVSGHVCAVDGEYGRVGARIPVAFPHGRPGNCVVHRLTAFRWPFGAMFAGGVILFGIWFWRRGGFAESPEAPAPANKQT